ncbi:hypothetical protein Tsubulata_005630 [Turnera subulata]|uniref:Peptidase A1 domain-containing protein n=1 Tax=Turnera subulata TaxID=218843 RepID=A0A9Q0JBA4_9ROSI|nr:hypothetical protein Tsubulata_005630 [Turnera subulata]
MATFSSSLFFTLAITLFLTTLITSTFATKGGFSVELIHRDSQKSPFYNSQETPFQRVRNALQRSIAGASRFSRAASVSPDDAVRSKVLSNQGEYIMSLSIGTPSFKILAIADTGSDLIWTQCQPCKGCYKQVAPLFDPKSSKTYRDLTCSSSQCQGLDRSTCTSGNICQYSYSYGDQSFTNGHLAVDTVTLESTNGRPVPFPKTVIGCGHNNAGTFNEKGSGIIGLGGGALSLVTQLGSAAGGKFSYCLVPFYSRAGNSSTLNFGSTGEVSGEGVVSTPLVSKDPDTFYFLTLEAISVGRKRVEFSDSSFGGDEGNIIIDSGTTLTLVPSDFLGELTSAIEAVVEGEKVNDPSGTLSLCYKADPGLRFPVLTAHFRDADVQLHPVNTFLQVEDGIVCFAFAGSDSGSIIGNIAQANFLVGYDIEGKSVSFKPTDCTKA